MKAIIIVTFVGFEMIVTNQSYASGCLQYLSSHIPLRARRIIVK